MNDRDVSLNRSVWVKAGMALRNLRRWTAALSIFLLIASPLSEPAADTPPPLLHLVSDHWPPFTAKEGSARFAIEIVQIALTRAGHPSSSEILSREFAQVVEPDCGIGNRCGMMIGSALRPGVNLFETLGPQAQTCDRQHDSCPKQYVIIRQTKRSKLAQ